MEAATLARQTSASAGTISEGTSDDHEAYCGSKKK